MVGIIEAENGVIGSILLSEKAFTEAAEILRAEDFYYSMNRDVFVACENLVRNGDKVDARLILQQMKKDGTHSEDASRRLVELIQITPTPENVVEYAKITLEHANQRRLIEKLESARERILAHEDAFAVATELSEFAGGLRYSEGTDSVLDMTQACVNFAEERDAIQMGKAKTITTGYAKLDKAIGGGLMRGGFYILAARPGIGKTTFSLNLSMRTAKAGNKVLYFPLEMNPHDMVSKVLAVETGLSATKMAVEKFADHEADQLYERMADGMSKAAKLPIYMYDARYGAPNVSKIVAFARSTKCDMLVIDYIGLMEKEKGNSLYERMTETSMALKKAALMLNIPVVCLAQLNREVENRNGPPRISDLRDSGGLEQDADAVFLMELPRKDRDMNPLADHEPEELIVHIGKNRRGRLCGIVYDFYMTQSIIHERRS